MQVHDPESQSQGDGLETRWQAAVHEELLAALVRQDRDRLGQTAVAGAAMVAGVIAGALITVALLAGERPANEVRAAVTVALIAMALASACAMLGMTLGRYSRSRSIVDLEALHSTWDPRYAGAALLASKRDLYRDNERVLNRRSRAVAGSLLFLTGGVVMAAGAGIAQVWL